MDRAGDTRHLAGFTRPAGDDGEVFDIDSAQRRGETVRVAFAADFAVGYDINPGLFHVADGDDSRIVLRISQERLGNAPDIMRPDTRRSPAHQNFPIHKPVRLRIAADDGRGEKRKRHNFLILSRLPNRRFPGARSLRRPPSPSACRKPWRGRDTSSRNPAR